MVMGAALLLAAVIVQIVLLERPDRPPAVEPREAAASPAPPPADLMARGLAFPVRGIEPRSIADSFTDARGATRIHNAMDIMAPRGTPVVAVDAGTVERLGNGGAGGITIYQVDEAGRYSFYYAHLDRLAAGLAVGRKVRRGEVLGYVGTTGNAPASAPHLHFAIYAIGEGKGRWGERPINPYPLWKGAAAD
jgi:murein DD-endopeptidase MepM/ murein hydrolase activator NlpD